MTRTLIDWRCPVCSWTGSDDESATDDLCPSCGHGLVDYKVELQS